MPNGIDKERKAESRNIYKGGTPTMLRRRKRNGTKLSLIEKIDIIKSVIVDTQDYKFLSKKYGVSISCISRLVQNMRDDRDFIIRLYKKERLKEGREDWI